MRDRILSVVSRVMDTPPGALTDASSPESVPSWESLRHMNLMMALEEEFGIRFTDEQMMEMVNVGLICQTVSRMAS